MLLPVRAVNPKHRLKKVARVEVACRQRVGLQHRDGLWYEVRQSDLLPDQQPEVLDREVVDRLRTKLVALPDDVRSVGRRGTPRRGVENVKRRESTTIGSYR